jgi:hypothetical protein
MEIQHLAYQCVVSMRNQWVTLFLYGDDIWVGPVLNSGQNQFELQEKVLGKVGLGQLNLL